MRRVVLCVAGLLAVACSTPSGPVPENVASASSSIESSEISTLHRFAVAICSGASANQCAFACSGVLVAPNMVLTVRHCIQAADRGTDCATDVFGSPLHPVNEYWITTSSSLASPDRSLYRVNRAIVPQARGLCGADLALLVLETNVPVSEVTPATPRVTPPLAASDQRVTVIGYGETAADAGDYAVRRILRGIPISCVAEDATRSCSAPYVKPNEFLIGQGGCDGDSGSAAFEQEAFNRGQAEVIGILSRGATTESGCFRNVYTRLDAWGNLFAKAGTLAAQLGGYEAPAWVPALTPVPLGANCNANDECQSALCESTDTGFSFRCTKECAPGDAAACPQGFACKLIPVVGQSESKHRCIEETPAPAETPSHSLCSMAPARRSWDPNTVTLLLSATLVAASAIRAGRRRRPGQGRDSKPSGDGGSG